jgi:hypothetical protein
MRARLTMLVVLSLAATAHAAERGGLIAVLPLDVTNTDGKMSKAAQASFEEMLRDVATDALASSGWTILSTQNQLQVLADNGVNAAHCGDESCHLAMAREIKADKFISGAVQFVEGQFTASVRLIDSTTGRIVVSQRVSAKSVTELRELFESKAPAFFSKASLAVKPLQPALPPQKPVDPAPPPAISHRLRGPTGPERIRTETTTSSTSSPGACCTSSPRRATTRTTTPGSSTARTSPCR